MKEWVMNQHEAMDPVIKIEITSDFNSKYIVTSISVTVDRIWLLIGFTELFNSWLHFTNHYHRLVFSVTLLGSGFQQCSVLGFLAQRLLSSLAGTFQLQLPGWTNCQSQSHIATDGEILRSDIHHSLTHGAEPFLRSRQMCSYSRTSQHFMELEGSLPCSQEPSIQLHEVS
jgi:hypothetical protein